MVWAASVAVLGPDDPALRRGLVVAGLCFLAVGGGVPLATTVAAGMAPGYDRGANAISDLVKTPETATLFNATLVAAGLVNALGGVLLSRARGGAALLALHLLAGIGAAGAGPVTLATPGVHGLFAVLGFFAFNLEAVAGHLSLRGQGGGWASSTAPPLSRWPWATAATWPGSAPSATAAPGG